MCVCEPMKKKCHKRDRKYERNIYIFDQDVE